MRLYAYAARYAHQQLPDLMGRRPTRLELLVFVQCVEELRQAEPTILGGLSTEGVQDA